MIRKPPPDLVDEQPIGLPASSPGSPAPITSTTGATSGRRTSSGRKRKAAPAARSGVGWLGGAVAAAALFVGLFFGALAAIGSMLAAGFRIVPADSPTLQAPVIEVTAPVGTQILLDGEAVGKHVPVQADVVHKLVVTLQGQEPWRTDILLRVGETRVIVLSPVEVKSPVSQKPKPR